MDTDKLVETARAKFAHEAARRVMKEKYEAKMLFAYRGGMWRAGPELLALLNFCRISKDSEIVILDLYENPIKINTMELWNLAAERWQEQMNAWYIEYEESRANR
jgi:hypothetical protein